MSYISLYRKYRPQKFEDVIGQEIIVRTLQNQIKTGNISHAYLFTGTRGTGKTTCAKILARAVNCLSPQNGDPCGECSSCKSIIAGVNYDVLEIDAASNNGVDEIRDLRDMLKYTPSAGKYKVFIIDEVHMLSDSARNAFLKTLEEPPEYVIFVLATTEAHKLPATILSRCQRFDFKLVSDSVLKQHIINVFCKENRKISDDAAALIASSGEGSVRDALSVADILISYCDGDVTYKDVSDVLGSESPEVLFKLVNEILNGKISAVLSDISDAARAGKNMPLLAADLSRTVRDILFVKNCSNAEETLELPNEVFIRCREIADNVENARLAYVLSTLSGTEQMMRGSVNARLILESAAIKATNLKASFSSDAILERIRELESKVEFGAVPLVPNETSQGSKNTLTGDMLARSVWGYIIKSLRQKKMFSTYSAAAVEANSVYFDSGVLSIFVPNQADYKMLSSKDTIDALEKLANEANSRVIRVEVLNINPSDTKDSDSTKILDSAREILKDIL